MNKECSWLVARILVLFLSSALFGMPAIDGGPEPDYSEGVNQPEVRDVARDDADLEGEWNCLILLVDFDDYTWDNQDDSLFRNENTPYDTEHFTEMLFSEESFAYPGSESEYTGSMRDYFSEISLDDFTVTGVVTEWYRAPEDYSYYTGNSYGTGGYPNNSQKLMEDLLELTDDDIDYSEFDNDEDGWVDALFVVHAGPGAEEHGRNETGRKYIWSHKWQIRTQERDGVNVSGYTVEPQSGTIGVFCHEFGHALGLPDLYDTDGSSEGIGEWGLMGSGGWAARPGDPWGTSPTHMCAWAKMQLDWVEIIDVERDMEGEQIPPIAENGEVYRLWRNGESAQSNEYFLLENRRRIGFDAGLTRRQIQYDLSAPEGLLITHVDDFQFRNSDDAHRLVDVEEASIVWIEGDPFEQLDGRRQFGTSDNLYNPNRGDDGDIWPGWSSTTEDSTEWDGDRDRDRFGIFTVPSSIAYDGSPSLVDVSNIHMDGENVIADLSVSAPDQPLLFVIGQSVNDENGGNGNGFIEPGETIELSVEIKNYGAIEAENVFAILTSESENLLIEVEEVGYASIPSDESVLSDDPFEISIGEDAPSFSTEILTIHIESNEQYEFDYPIYLQIRPATEWFKYPDNPVLDGDPEEYDDGILTPSVIIENDTARCWYSTGNMELEPPYTSAIGYAWSVDGGENWSRSEEPMITVDETDWVAGGFVGLDVINLGEEGYLMAINGTDSAGVLSVGLANSMDGMNWNLDEDPIIDAESNWGDAVFQGQLALYHDIDGRLCLLFNVLDAFGAPAIAFASLDGEDEWQVDEDLFFSASGQMQSFDAYMAVAPEVYFRDGMYEMIYAGIGGDFISRIGKAVSEDGINFERQEGTETGGSILEPGGRGTWDDEEWIYGGAVFEWESSRRMLYNGITSDFSRGSVGLAASVEFEDQHVERSGNSAISHPGMFILDPAYPNPFNNSVTIPYRILTPGRIQLSIFDLSGRLVKRNESLHEQAGSHSFIWNGDDTHFKMVSSGYYLVQLEMNGERTSHSLLFMK